MFAVFSNDNKNNTTKKNGCYFGCTFVYVKLRLSSAFSIGDFKIFFRFENVTCIEMPLTSAIHSKKNSSLILMIPCILLRHNI